jgi:hypothetical protein
MARSSRQVVRLGLMLAVCASPLGAQRPATAVVRVRVTDPAGAPVARAELAILDAAAPEAVAVATTDSAGRHTFSLALGSAGYRITARKLGFVSTIRRLAVAPGDTVTVDLRLAAMAAVQELPMVVTREHYRLDTDPGNREGFAQRCASPLVACIADSTLAARPSGDLLSFLNHAHGMIPQSDNGYAPDPPKMFGTFTGQCEPVYYVNGFRWPKDTGFGWKALAEAYRGFAVEGIEVYRAGQPRPGRFSGDPGCGVVVFWLK